MQFIKQSISLIIFFYFLNNNIVAQQCFDTTHTLKISAKEIENHNQKKGNAKLNATIDYVPLKIHILIDTLENQAKLEDLYADLEELNKSFMPINIQFYISSSINYIKNNNLYKLDKNSKEEQLVSTYNEPKVIDVFYVGDMSYLNACGVSSLGWDIDGYIIMNNSCMRSSTLIHEFGHYFNLNHTHNVSNGKETVNGNNCSITGDLICDTPADPGLAGKVTYDCKYLGTDLDPNNTPYKPDIYNFMSYSSQNCRNKFTSQQYQRMRYYYDNTLNLIINYVPKADFLPKLLTSSNTIIIGKNDFVKFIIKNTSNVNYNGNVDYEIFLTDNVGNKTLIKSGFKNKLWVGNISDTIIEYFTIPTDIKEGLYKINIEIDQKNSINEAVENNNLTSQNISILNKTTNLVDWDLKVISPKLTNYAGYEYTFNFITKNIGTKDAIGNYSLGVYVSKDEYISADDASFGGIYEILKIGEESSNEFQIPLTQNLETPVYVIVTVDLFNQEVELNENNNKVILKIFNILPTKNFKKPDLVFTKASIANNRQYKQLSYLSGTFDFNNIGDTAITQTPFNLYISKDSIYDTSDILIDATFARLNQNTGIWNTLSGNLPPNLNVGKYYLISYLDPNNIIAEKNELNNTFSIPINIVAGDLIDYQFTSTKLNENIWLKGKNWTFDYTITNKGLSSGNGTTTLFYYLQKDKIIYELTNNIRYGLESFQNQDINLVLPVGSNKSFKYVGPITSTLEEGEYYFATCIDASSEYNNNNCWVSDKPILILNKPLINSIDNEGVLTNEISVYPNPTNSILKINTSLVIDKIEIYSLDGINHKIQLNNNEIDLSYLNKGIYTLLIYSKNTFQTKKIIKD